MAQRDENGGFVRIEALMAVARLSISDPDFLNGLKDDLDRTLWRYGFALSPAEVQDAREYFVAKADDRNNEIVRSLERNFAELADLPPTDRTRFWRVN